MTHAHSEIEPGAARPTQKLTRDIVYSIASFGVLAASGLIINVVMTSLRDATALGVFNQTYAIYIMASQLATMGLHYSVLRHSALAEGDALVRGKVLGTAAAGALCGGTLAALVIMAAAGGIAAAFDSPQTGSALRVAAAGLTLFPLNKVLLAHLNALRHMRAYALLQVTRYSAIMVVVTLLCASKSPTSATAWAFFAAEALTVVAASIYIHVCGEFRNVAVSKEWMCRHCKFGSKALLAGMFAEFNSRIDVMLIGIFLPDREVGIYSFAAMLADGLYNVLAVIRLNVNPILVRTIRDGNRAELTDLLTKSKKMLVPAAGVLSVGVLVGFWALGTYLLPGKGLAEGLPSLVVLVAALVVVSPMVPFDNLLLVSGHPGYQTLQQLAMVVTNVVVGVALLTVLGIVGVAVGTAASYLASAGVLVLNARRQLNWNLITNSFL